MSVENFTCGRCGYASTLSLAECPDCGFVNNTPIKKPDMPRSRVMPTGTYLAPISEAKSAATNIRVVQIFKVVCGIFSIIAICMLAPFFIYPMALGPDHQGMYQMPRGRKPSGPGKATAGAIYTGAAVTLTISVGLFVGFIILRRKENEMRDKFDEDGHGNPEDHLNLKQILEK